MQVLVIAVFLSVMTFEYLIVEQQLLPAIFRFAPEILAMVSSGVVIAVGVANRFQYVRSVYWLLFGSMLLVMFCGALINELDSGPLFGGIRTYFRAIPFFFLAAVTSTNERQLALQVRVLLALTLIQLPLAYWQRMQGFSMGETTGDHTFGTLMNSTSMSLYVIAAACVLTGYFLRRQVSPMTYVLLLVVFLAPTMLNESKGALIIAPLALFMTFVAGSKPGDRVKNILWALVVIVGFVLIFVPIYDYFMVPRWGYGLLDFFLMEGRLEGYLERGGGVGQTDVAPGKIASLRLALSAISADPSQFVFGLGIANTTDSALGSQFHGKYFMVYGVQIGTSLGQLLAEIGIGGVAVVALLYWNIFKDSLVLIRNDHNMVGALGVGWTGVLVTMSIGLASHNAIESTALSALFWYFSGLVAASRMRLTAARAEEKFELARAGRGASSNARVDDAAA